MSNIDTRKNKIIERFHLSANLVGFDVTEWASKLDNYKSEIYYVNPHYTVNVGSFVTDYWQSAISTRDILGLKSNERLCTMDGKLSLLSKGGYVTKLKDLPLYESSKIRRSIKIALEKHTPSTDELLFMLYNLLLNVQLFYDNTMEEFIKMYGYDDSYKHMKQGEAIYNESQDIARGIRLGVDGINSTLEELVELGIE